MPGPADAIHPFALRSRRIVTPTGTVAGVVIVEGDTITHVLADDATKLPGAAPANEPTADETDLGDLALLPGFIDAHVHLNDPRPKKPRPPAEPASAGVPPISDTEPWEGFDTGTLAAAAAGITTVVDMPLNSIPVTTTRDALRAKRDAAKGNLHVDAGFYAGLVPGNLDELPGLLDAGVLGVKCFLCDSGLPEFPAVDHDTLAEAMALLAAHAADVPLLAHAERVHDLPCALASLDPRKYASWLASRPNTFEQRAVAKLLDLVAATRCRLHVVHVADADTLPLIRDAKRNGLPVTAETCPHYVAFTSDDVAQGDTRFKCAPPIREPRHREALWDALRDGTLDFVASDHSPCPRELKHLDTGDFFQAWGGIASLQIGPAVTWTHAHRRGFTLDDFASWWCHAPGRMLDLPCGITPGGPANLVAFDPEAAWTVDAKTLHHRHPVTPYDGTTLHGKPEHVWLRGTRIIDHGRLAAGPYGHSVFSG